MQTAQAALALLMSVHTPANGGAVAISVVQHSVSATFLVADNNPPQIQDPEQQEEQAEQAQQQQHQGGGHG